MAAQCLSCACRSSVVACRIHFLTRARETQALREWSLSHWTTRSGPRSDAFNRFQSIADTLHPLMIFYKIRIPLKLCGASFFTAANGNKDSAPPACCVHSGQPLRTVGSRFCHPRDQYQEWGHNQMPPAHHPSDTGCPLSVAKHTL